METILKLSLIGLLSYFVGSFPSAVIISKRFFGFDIREKGSGNMGSTNAFRVLGWKWGLMVQVLDIFKGLIAVLVIAHFLGKGIAIPNATMFEDFTLIKIGAGICAVAGHIWSVFVGFRGGKGINTAAGMLLAIAPLDLGIAIGIFLVAVILSGYISLGSISASAALPSSLFLRYNLLHDNIPGYDKLILFAVGLMMLVIFTHRTNIKRLLEGNETRFAKLGLIKCKVAEQPPAPDRR